MRMLSRAGLYDSTKLSRYFSKDYNALCDCLKTTFKNVVSRDLSVEFVEVSSKTLLIYGAYDRATPVYMGKRLARLIKNSYLVVIDGGHYCFSDNRCEFMALMLSFFDGRLRAGLFGG